MRYKKEQYFSDIKNQDELELKTYLFKYSLTKFWECVRQELGSFVACYQFVYVCHLRNTQYIQSDYSNGKLQLKSDS